MDINFGIEINNLTDLDEIIDLVKRVENTNLCSDSLNWDSLYVFRIAVRNRCRELFSGRDHKWFKVFLSNGEKYMMVAKKLEEAEVKLKAISLNEWYGAKVVETDVNGNPLPYGDLICFANREFYERVQIIKPNIK